MASVFSKIINGEIPAHKVYEDERTIAFLDISPHAKGHTLVVPKTEVVRFYDLEDDDYFALMDCVRKLARHLKRQLGAHRVGLLIDGEAVAHAHVHLIPLMADETMSGILTEKVYSGEPDHNELSALAQQLRLNVEAKS